MYHLAASFFFSLVLIGAAALCTSMLKNYRDELHAALLGEMPRRRSPRAWTRLIRVTVRPLPILALRPNPALAAARLRSRAF